MLDFLCIGAQKAGTTWLYENLKRHPDILFPAGKELHFWDQKKDKGIDWYKNLFPDTTGKVSGEITPAYAILSQATIKEVHKNFPHLKLVYIVRNPVERAWSAAQMIFKQQGKNPAEVDKALYLEQFNSEGSLRRGDYETCLKNWLRVYPKEQLLLLHFEEIKLFPKELLIKCAKHLGVSLEFYLGIDESIIREKIYAGEQEKVPPEFLPKLQKIYASKKVLFSRLVEKENISHFKSGNDPKNCYDPRKLNNKCVFIAGLHRSGTTLLHQLLATHPEVSGFRQTNVPQDEGQHLQTVFPMVREYGGPGKFCLQARQYREKTSSVLNDARIMRLMAEWAPYWDLNKPVLIEKSPPNIIRTPYLQGIFKHSYFIFIVRHPVAVSFATSKWTDASMPKLFLHWKAAHEIAQEDSPKLTHSLWIRYEDLVANPEQSLEDVCRFIGIKNLCKNEAVNEGKSEGYFAAWHTFKTQHPIHTWRISKNKDFYQRFGYSLASPYINTEWIKP